MSFYLVAMSRFFTLTWLVLMVAISGMADAAGLSVLATDGSGQPVGNAVVSLRPANGTAPPASRAPEQKIIDQQNETFLPLVTLLWPGDSIIFRNSDKTRHHVYSFSAIRQFQYLIDVGTQSPPVLFDKPGVAAIGCNIHDQMVAYVYVAASPWTALTAADGRVRLDALPPGDYVATAWHPRLRPGSKPPAEPLHIADTDATLTLPLALLSDWNRPVGHRHTY